MERIAVIGCGGSGKSTIARRLAAHLDLPLTHLDSVYYDQEWNPLPQKDFAFVQERLVAGERRRRHRDLSRSACGHLPVGNWATPLAVPTGRP